MRTFVGCVMMIDVPRGGSVYVDSNVFIYFIEKVPGFFESSKAMFVALAQCEARVITSELSVAECLYLPSRDGHSRLVDVYDQFFAPRGNVKLVALTGSVARTASQTGGVLGLKLLDAIHYVSAMDVGCTHFLTGDKAFKSSEELRVVHL
jgi:predicted nucleic acid-binding protein